jgi:hypothetical protein
MQRLIQRLAKVDQGIRQRKRCIVVKLLSSVIVGVISCTTKSYGFYQYAHAYHQQSFFDSVHDSSTKDRAESSIHRRRIEQSYKGCWLTKARFLDVLV